MPSKKPSQRGKGGDSGRVPRFRPGMTRNVLTKIRFERNLRGVDIAEACGVRPEIIQRIERGAGKGSRSGKVARNHPAIPAIAKAYGVSVETMAPFLGPASDYWNSGDDGAPKHAHHTTPTVPLAAVATKGRTGPESPLVAIRFAKGLTVTALARKAHVDRKLLAHIETMRGTVRPDMPSLPRIAKAYGVPLDTIVAELRAHYVAPAPPRDAPHPNTGKRDPVRVSVDAGPLAHRRAELGLTVKDVEKAADTGSKVIEDLERGRMPPNHPYIPHLAPIYKMSADELRAHCTGPAMPEKYVMKLTTQRENRHSNKRTLKKHATPKADTLPKGVRLVAVPKAAAVPTNGNGKRSYNKLTRVPMNVREFVRGLVTDVNVRIMQGEDEIILAPMPMHLVRGFLGDYLKAKGIDTTMLLDVDFAKQFG